MSGMASGASLAQIWRDQTETWSLAQDEATRRRDHELAVLRYFAGPLAVAVAALIWHLEVNNVGQILAGVAVFTGFLFTLLVLMFNTGVTLRKDGSTLANAHGLETTVSDLRANATYTAAVGMVLALLLVVAAALTPSGKPLAWGWTPGVGFLALHFGLNLLSVLQRLRTAFNYITR